MAGNTDARKTENVSTKWYNIDMFMLPAKLIYVFYGLKISCYEPYMILFLISIGLTPTDAGIIGGLRLIGFVVGGIFWGYLADQEKRYHLVIAITTIGLILAMFVQPFLSLYIGEKRFNTCPIQSFNTKYVFQNYTNTSLRTHGTLSNKNINALNKLMEIKSDNYSTLFYSMLFLNMLAKFFEGPHNGFADSGVIERIRMHPVNPDYGFQRVYGPSGFAMGIIISNIFVDYFPSANVTCYTAVFIAFFIINTGFLINAFILYSGLTFASGSGHTTSNNKSVIKELRKDLYTDKVFFLVTVLVSGMEQSFFISFTFVLLKEMNAPTIVNGLSIAIGAIVCTIVFYWGTVLVKKIGGIWLTILICNFLYFIRFITMAFIHNAWLIPLLQIFQMFNYGLFLVAVVFYVKETTKPEIQTVMYTITNALYFGAGVMIANLLGGKIIEMYNARILFSIAAYVALVWTIITGAYIFLTRKSKRKSNQMEIKISKELEALM